MEASLSFVIIIGVAVLAELLFAVCIRAILIGREDRRIREWQSLPSEAQPDAPSGYRAPGEEPGFRRGRFVARVYLLGVLPFPENMGLKMSSPDNAALSKRVTVISFRPWLRACSRIVWSEESTEEAKRESRLAVLVFSVLAALCASVCLLLALRGSYYLSALLWAHKGAYVTVAALVGTVLLYRHWRS